MTGTQPLLYSLYRVTIPGGASDYWRVLDIAADGILWACLAVGRRDERIVTSYGEDVIVEATDKALIGKKVQYEAFSR